MSERGEIRVRSEDDPPGQERADGEAPEAQPVKPKRKKKKRKKKASARPPSPPKPASAFDSPAFLRSFPSDPELDRLVAAFEAGDYATVRRNAPALAERTEDPQIRDAALELTRRIEPDPLIRYMLIASIGLLVFLMFYFYGHRH
jgi:hypothetical protein